MNINFTNNFDLFLFVSGEVLAAYFARDKIYLNVDGTKEIPFKYRQNM